MYKWLDLKPTPSIMACPGINTKDCPAQIYQLMKTWGHSRIIHTVTAGLSAARASHCGENDSLSFVWPHNHIHLKHCHIKWYIIPLSCQWENGYLCRQHWIALQLPISSSACWVSGDFRCSCWTTNEAVSPEASRSKSLFIHTDKLLLSCL